MNLLIAQLDTAWEDPQANMDKAEQYLRRAEILNCDVAVFPEMFTTGFSMNIKKTGEPKDGPTRQWLSRAAREHGIHILAGIAGKGIEERGRNLAVAYDANGTCVGEYQKMHPFTRSGEHRHFIPGPAPEVFTLSRIPASAFICYDLRFPEVFRTVAERVQIIFVLANWPAERADHWDALLRARAIENQCFVCGANRVGTDGYGIDYAGGSQVVGPWGRVLARGGDREQPVIAELDMSQVERVRGQYPFLRDRRPFTLASEQPSAD